MMSLVSLEWITLGLVAENYSTYWNLCSAVVVCTSAYYFLRVAQRPVLACRENGKWSNFLRTHLPILQEKFWPTPWCFESRAQTIIASVVKTATLPGMNNYKRELFKLSDGGEIYLDWLESPQAHDDDAPTVVFLPGLTGHSQSEYIRSFVTCAHELGARCVVFNNRGRGGIPLKTARTYCAANSDDFEEIVKYIKRKYPSTRLVATGVSLGGMILGNYLSTRGSKASEYLEASMVLSIPWNVFIGTESLEKPLWNLLLNKHLAQCLCDSVRHMKDMLGGINHPWDFDSVVQSRTIREFDDRFTAKQFGFRDVNHYYETACLHDKIDRIRVPLICLSAADDPFQPIEGIPIKEANESSHVAIVITTHGGHIGFMEGLLPSKVFYSDRLYSQLLAGIFNNPKNMKAVANESNTYADKCHKELKIKTRSI